MRRRQATELTCTARGARADDRAASAAVTPRSITSAAAWSFSRCVMRHPRGSGGTGPVNVFTGHDRFPHSSRRLCTLSRTWRPPQRTSFDPAATC